MSSLLQTPGDARDFWDMPDPGRASLAWLGQAGFAVRWQGLRLLIDPYLSDSLAEKYRGSDKPHERMMPSPITPGEVHLLDYVLCTHSHSDHMDPGTLPALARHNPFCCFVVPQAESLMAAERGVPRDRIMPMDAKERLVLAGEVELRAIPAAHESLETDAGGHHRYLGYILQLGGRRIWHSGDSVPYPGLAETLCDTGIDLALLPVNGRGKGVAGNFTFKEAVELCRLANIPDLVPHHFGMFAFNSVDPGELKRQSDVTTFPRCHLPDTGHWLHFNN